MGRVCEIDGYGGSDDESEGGDGTGSWVEFERLDGLFGLWFTCLLLFHGMVSACMREGLMRF